MTNTQNKLFVANLPFSTTKDELQGLFSQCGEVVEVSIPINRDTGRPRGFAFVTMGSKEATDKALSLHEHDIQGRKIIVNVANERR